jgi:hypothetical protein
MAVGKLLKVPSNGKLQIDAFVQDYGKGHKEFLRSEIERLARKVVTQAAYTLEPKSMDRERAAGALQAVGDLVDAVGRLSDLKPLDVAIAFEPKDDAAHLPPSQAWTQISDALKRTRRDHDHILQWYHAVRERLQLVEPAPGDASDLLINAFVVAMSDFHKRQIGRSAPKGRTGKFVRLLEAAWIDLDFPEPSLHSLGHQAERLPQLQKSLSRRMRQ